MSFRRPLHFSIIPLVSSGVAQARFIEHKDLTCHAYHNPGPQTESPTVLASHAIGEASGPPGSVSFGETMKAGKPE
jgi:hypothetical protein